MTAADWPIRSRRALIRSVAVADLPDIARIVTMPEVARMLFLFRPGMPLTDVAAHFPVTAAMPPFRAVIEIGGRVAGSIGAGAGKLPPIWYFLDPAVSGQGVATEVACAFVGWLDARHGFPAIRADVFTDNPASRRVLEKAGFRVTGRGEATSAARSGPAPIWSLERRRGQGRAAFSATPEVPSRRSSSASTSASATSRAASMTSR